LRGLTATVPILKCLTAVAAVEEKNRVSVAAIAATGRTTKDDGEKYANRQMECVGCDST
jgi:hypothetical protein